MGSDGDGVFPHIVLHSQLFAAQMGSDGDCVFPHIVLHSQLFAVAMPDVMVLFIKPVSSTSVEVW